MRRGCYVAVLAAILSCVVAPPAASAADVSAPPNGRPAYFGLLRARDLTFFSLPQSADAWPRQSGLAELTKTKYQASLGVYRSFPSALLSLAITENLQNLNNTPDVGLQLSLDWLPAPGSHAGRLQ